MSQRAVVQIGEQLVGPQQRTLIIAEAGVNHDGSVDKALRLVEAAAAAGAELVKFQVFRAAELVIEGARAADYQQARGARSQREMLQALELSDADLTRISEHCRACGIEFLATPFGPGDVDLVVGLGVRAIKIASTDLTNTLLLRRSVETGLPLIVSTGAATAGEISAAVARLRDWGASERLILMHCVSGYPAPLEAANLRAISTLCRTAGVPCGFSDHTRSTQIAAWAVAAGACVLEKHFTLDRDAVGPDHAMSLDPTELADYVATARAVEAALGSGRLGMTELEAEVRSVARRSLVAATWIAAGTTITPAMLTAKRPGGGIEPDRMNAIAGRRAAVDIAADTVLTWDMLA